MNEKLEEKIKQRKEQADEKKIYEKIGEITKYGMGYFGYAKKDRYKDIEIREDQEDTGPSDSGEFPIAGCSELSVIYKGKLVLQFKETSPPQLISYVPGRWETKINELYKIASKKTKQIEDQQKKEKKTLEQKKERELRKKFGL